MGREMNTPVLNDASQFPAEEIIFAWLGKTGSLWSSLFNYIRETYPEINSEWRYYRDGKSWLLKVTRKLKTVFWLSVIKGAFRITFYFGDTARDLIMKSSLSDELQEQYNHKTGLRAVTVIVKNKKNINSVKELIDIKLRLK